MSGEASPRLATVRLADLVMDGRFQVRGKLDRATVNRYAVIGRNGGSLPPIKVMDVRGALVLVDGWHRVDALRQNGESEAEAEVTDGTESEARWAAATANLAHGLPLKKKELKEVFKAYVGTRKHIKGRGRLKSYREIAADLNGAVSHNTIRSWMLKHFKEIALRMGGHDFEGGGGGGGSDEGGWSIFGDKTKEALSGLQAVREAFNAVTCPDERRQVVERAREVSLELSRAGNLAPPPSDLPF